MSELWELGAGELAVEIATGEVSAIDVVEAHLERIEAVNGELNAIVHVLADEARTQAVEVDAAVNAGHTLGPLSGVPFTIKDNIDVAGLPTTWGMPALGGAIASVDAPVVERMKAAGAIPIGRTNLPDMGLRIHTDSGLYGRTKNPWHPERTAGGSSGGEAVALATGMTPIGLGNDLGGSLRNPASCCGIASIKPSTGRVPNMATIPMPDATPVFDLFAVQGPMARTVADVRLGLEILAGWDARDPQSVPAPLEGPPIDGPIRVAVVPEPPGGSTDPGVAARIRAAADALADAGYDVVEETPPAYEEAIEVWTTLVTAEIRVIRPLLEPMLSPDALTFLTAAEGEFPELDLGGYLMTFADRSAKVRAWATWLETTPLVLTPTWTQPPFVAGADVVSTQAVLDTLELLRPVMPANALGLPSACVPAGLADGLPIGALVTGARFREDLCLDAAEVIEAALAEPTPIDPRW